MKNILFYLTILVVATIDQQVAAQNIPLNSSGGNPTYTETAPLDFTQVSPSLPSPILYNYKRVYTPAEPMTSIPSHSNLSATKLTVNTMYMDGWGRPLQAISQTVPTSHVVMPFDNRAKRTQTGYLPYFVIGSAGKFRTQPYSEQATKYANDYPAEGNTAYSKTKSYSDNGLLTTLSYSPGKELTGENRGVKTTIHIGSSSNISGVTTLYKLEHNSTNNTICTTGTYSTSEYTVTRTEGQHNAELLTYSDKSGRLICKKERAASNTYLITYYVYNLLGQLTHIVPPVQTSSLISNGCLSNVIQSANPAQVFAYEFNKYGQAKATQTPGKNGLDKVIYDRYHRPFLSQSPVMALTGKTYFTLYDKLGRVVITGLFTDNSSMSDYHYDGIKNGTISLPTYLDGQGQPIPDQNKLEYWLQNDIPVNNYPVDGTGEPFLAGCEIHTLNYYDRYDVAPANQVSFSTSYSSYYLTGAASEQPVPYYMVHGEPVATKTRILDNGYNNNWSGRKWITSVSFYDDKGRTIQTHTLNPWQQSNWDIATMQYNFSGQNILSVLHHKGTALGNKSQGTTIVEKYTFNAYNNRLEKTEQQIDGGAWYNINTIQYDNLGRVNTKLLGNVEIQQYNYGMRGELIGINDNYVHNFTPSTASKRTYASILSYETGFSYPRYDGKLSGYQWRNAGSIDPMAYGYEYDDAGRMTHAEYRYNNGMAWAKSARDYTVSNLAYDANGNLQSMKQRGDDNNGNPAPTDIDILTYTYDASGTRLMSIADGGNPSSLKIHDLEDNNTSGNDFAYDKNGNLKQDLNRGVNDISYTFQDMPKMVEKTNSDGNVKNIYTADGALLQKVITDNRPTTPVVTVYHYWGPFVYKDNDLEMVMHDEGRCRFDGTAFAYDYFVRDHLGNVRNIVKGTMSYGQLTYQAGFETVAAATEESIFSQVGEVRDLKPQGMPGDLESAILNGAVDSERIGAAIVVHAMAGEKFNVKGYGYYDEENPENYNMYPMEGGMLESLTNSLMAGVAEGGEGITPTQVLNNLLTTTNYNVYEGLKQAATNSNYPRAYINYLVFNEDFELQADYSHVVQIDGAPGSWHLMEIPGGDQEMPMNGYLMFYFSNESNMDVAMDNLYIINYESTLLEEQHYYPHGMVIEAGQGAATNTNKYLFQGNQLQNELDLFINDFNYRQYDAQIGRFMGVDPLAESAGQESWNPYQFCGNDPANFVDPLGLSTKCGSKPQRGNFWKWLGGLFSGGGGDGESNISWGWNGTEGGSPGGSRYYGGTDGEGGGDGGTGGADVGASMTGQLINNAWFEYQFYQLTVVPWLEMQNKGTQNAMKDGYHSDGTITPFWEQSSNVPSNPNKGAPLYASAGDGDGKKMKSASEYDYSKSNNSEKFQEDWQYILNGDGGSPVSRWWNTFYRDWNARDNVKTREDVDVLVTIASAIPLVRYGGMLIPRGFKEVKNFGYLHGQKVFHFKGRYYSRDIDGHNGGVWKVFELKSGKLQRIGTADSNLNMIKK